MEPQHRSPGLQPGKPGPDLGDGAQLCADAPEFTVGARDLEPRRARRPDEALPFVRVVRVPGGREPLQGPSDPGRNLSTGDHRSGLGKTVRLKEKRVPFLSADRERFFERAAAGALLAP